VGEKRGEGRGMAGNPRDVSPSRKKLEYIHISREDVRFSRTYYIYYTLFILLLFPSSHLSLVKRDGEMGEGRG